nr:MAG TPA: hypothetical protein [Bacteriophage sp.]
MLASFIFLIFATLKRNVLFSRCKGTTKISIIKLFTNFFSIKFVIFF